MATYQNASRGAELLRAGHLTPEEFTKAKQELLLEYLSPLPQGKTASLPLANVLADHLM